MVKEIFVTESLKNLVKKAQEKGGQVFVVGGYVRNALLGFTTSDIDLAGNLKQQAMLDLCAELGYFASVISEKLGTLVIKNGDEQYEYTTFRTEKYPTGGVHTPEFVEFVDNMEQDSKRRDFTVNALYYSPLTNEVTDHVNGLADLEKRVLKCIDSPETVFENDGLRIMRFMRFACELNFTFDKESYKAAKQQMHQLKDISKVRMLKELKEILNSDSKYSTFSNQQKRAVTLFNDLGIYPYLFNNSFQGFNLKMKGKLWKAYLNTTKQNRYYVFMVLVLLAHFKQKQTTVSNIHFAVNTLLGNGGLQDSNDNINKIINLYIFFQNFWFLKPISNDLCLKFNELGDVTKLFFKHLNPKKVVQLESRTSVIQTNKIPFKIGDLSVQVSEMLSSGISPKLISKIRVILFNECLNENIKNEKEVLMEQAKKLNDKLS